MSVVTVTVKSAGALVDPRHALLSVDIRRELNRVPTAMLVYADGDAASRSFELCDSGIFAPGKEVEIAARYEGAPGAAGKDRVLFKGPVARHGTEADARGSVLRVELRDKAVKLTRPRRSQVAADTKDSDLIKKLVSGAGLQAKVDATTVEHAQLVQYDCSDWDWLITRAEANGLVVSVVDGVVTVTQPDTGAAPALQIDYGIDEVYELEFECDALGQDASFKARTWDPTGQATREVSAPAAPSPTQGKLGGSGAAKALGFAPSVLLDPVNLLQDEAQAWAGSEARRAQLSLVRGRGRVPGLASAALLSLVEIKGVAKAFAGKALVSGLCHRIDANGWITELQFGLSAQAHRHRADIAPLPAAGLLPAVSGLHIGIVEAVSDDPAGEHRVKVKLPGLGDQAPGLWARWASPDAGKDRGWYFCPEPDDEVVLGFFNDDPRQPVVLGALFGSKKVPPAAIVDTSSKNTLRGLVSRSGLTFGLVDEDKPQLYLETPGGAKLLLDDDQQAIVLSDPHGNKLTLDKDGITLVSAKDFKVDASGNVEIRGAKVDLK